MRPLSVFELLDLWEGGLAARPFERALAILAAACPESSPPVLARLSIGRRDARLLQLREWAFGSRVAVVAGCPRCRQPLETVMCTADLRAAGENAGDAELSLAFQDYELRCRLPNSEDLAACVGLDLAMSRQTLLAHCVIDSRRRGETLPPEQLPAEVTEAAIRQIGKGDPQADVRVDFTCPDCNYRWNEPFDIVSFLWAEIDAWARRLLREVHILASAYGWTQRDILALSPLRRQIYLAMAQT